MNMSHAPRVGCLLLLLSATALTSVPARAQNGTWHTNPGSSNFNTGSNWSSGSMPTGTASFGASTTTNLTLSNGVTLGSVQFNAGAPAYTFNLGVLPLNFTGAGIVNNSGNSPTFILSAPNNTPTPGSMTFNGAGTTAANANIVNNGNSTVSFLSGATAGSATITNNGNLAVSRFLNSSPGSATITNTNGGNLKIIDSDNGSATIINNSGGVTDFQSSSGNSSTGAARIITNAGGQTNINTANVTVGSIEGAGTYIIGPGTFGIGSILTVGTNNLSTTASGTITGLLNSSLVKVGSGTLTLSGTATLPGGTTVVAGGMIVTGTLASNTTIASGGTLGGSGTLSGNLTNSGTLAPGNVGGTFTVTGNLVHNAGATYQVGANAAGQSDRVNVGGTATLNGGTVQVVAASGTYAPTTTYTILNASSGVSGTFSGVSSNFAFLTPSLSYDPNNVYLTLSTNFANNSLSGNQSAVGGSLNSLWGSASSDFLTILNALAVLSPSQGAAALAAISGQSYAGFSTAMAANAQMYMNNLASQAGSAGNNRTMLAEACDVACDTTAMPLWGVWGGAVGGLGTIGAGQATGAVTYNSGGFAAGLDRRFTENFLAGVTVGYTTGTQWISGLDGRATSDTVQAGIYGSLSQGPIYLDALAGWAFSYNQSWRNIAIPGLQPVTARGQTGANQFYGQLESGYRFDIGGRADAYVTPFARLQGFTATQNAFTETGAGTLNLNVAAATTNSLRSVLGAVLGGEMDMGWRSKLATQFRLGWSHEYASVNRPVAATFAGAPTVPFTTFGVSPQRDGVLLGLSANTEVADGVSLYMRYEGTIAGPDNAQAATVGVRVIW